MGLQFGKYRFPEDLLEDRAKLHALIEIVAQRLGISQEEWDAALERATDKLIRQDPSLQKAPKDKVAAGGQR